MGIPCNEVEENVKNNLQGAFKKGIDWLTYIPKMKIEKTKGLLMRIYFIWLIISY